MNRDRNICEAQVFSRDSMNINLFKHVLEKYWFVIWLNLSLILQINEGSLYLLFPPMT